MPKSDEDWEADNSSLGSVVVPQALSAQSVEEKNMVLCVGIYNSFSSKYGVRNRCNSRKLSVKRHNRAFKRITREKNAARRELRAAQRGRKGGGRYQGSG